MAGNNSAVIERSLARTLSRVPPRQQLRGMLVTLYGSINRFAIEHKIYREQVAMTLDGSRPYPEVRDLIATVCGLTRAQVDSMIDGEQASAA